MPENCLFCKIINGDIPSDKLYEDDKTLAFRDINPVAEQHILVIPKKHYSNLKDFEEKDKDDLAEIIFRLKEIAKSLNIENYRTVINTGEGAGQTVFHIHAHLIAGRKLEWPPG